MTTHKLLKLMAFFLICRITNCDSTIKPSTTTASTGGTQSNSPITCSKPLSSLSTSVRCATCQTSICSFDERCQFECKIGYTSPIMQQTSTCTNVGWEPTPISCQAITCSKPLSSLSTSVRCATCQTSICSFDERCQFECKIGYTSPIMQQTSTCTNVGWEPTPISCQAITCSKPLSSLSTSVRCATCQTSICSFDERCQFECNIGYISPIMQQTSTCTNVGWEPTPISCKAITCSKPLSSLSTSVRCATCQTSICSFDERCQFECNIGYTSPIMQQTSTCTNVGWEPTPISCKAITCSKPLSSLSTSVRCATCQTSICSFDERCQFECNIGYTSPIMQQTSTCTNVGWEPTPISCKAITCPKPTTFPHGNISCSSRCGNTLCAHNGWCEYQCYDGYTPAAKLTAICLSTGWSNSAPTCQAITCRKPTKFPQGKISCSSTCDNSLCPYNVLCDYQCNVGYTPVAKVTARCLSLGWSESTPTCQVQKCSTVALSHGSVKCGSYNCRYSRCPHGTFCTFSCFSEYQIVGDTSATCNSGRWSNPAPQCQEKWRTYTSTVKKCQYTISNFPATSYDDAKRKCNTVQSSLAILKTDIQSKLPLEKFYFVGLMKTQFWAWNDNSNFTGQFVTGSGYCGQSSSTSYRQASCTSAALCVCEKALSFSNFCKNVCQNGGTCTVVGCSYTCACTLNYKGLNCETRKIEINTTKHIVVNKGKSASVTANIVTRIVGSYICEVKSITGRRLKIYTNQEKFVYQAGVLEKPTNYTITCSFLDNTAIHDTKMVYVDVQVLPTSYVSLTTLKLNRNQTKLGCHILCSGSGNPKPDVFWKRSGRTVYGSSKKPYYQKSVTGNQSTNIMCLRFNKARYEDSGIYVCTVQSELATVPVTKSVTITIEGVPEEIPSKYTVMPVGNSVSFNCSFQGNPLPNVVWKFANGSLLPKTSQFQVLNYEDRKLHIVTKELMVYGVICPSTTSFLYKCFADNIYSKLPSESETYNSSPVNMWSLLSEATSCTKAIESCKALNGRLAVIDNKADSEYMRKFGRRNVWIAGISKYFSQYSNNACKKIWIGTNNNYQYPPFGKVVGICDASSSVQPTIRYKSDKCDGSKVNVTWNLLPGTLSIQHKLEYNGMTRIVDPGKFNVIISNLQGGSSYNVTVFPMFEGCRDFKPSKQTVIKTPDPSLKPPYNVRLQLETTRCIISWKQNNNQSKFYSTKLSYTANVSGSSNEGETRFVNLSKSALSYVIGDLLPNTNYSASVGVMPLLDCKGLVLPAWSTFSTGSCVTASKGPTSVKLSPTNPAPSANGMEITLEPTSERNGAISCYFVVAYKVVNQSTNHSEADVTKLKQAGDTVLPGEPYVAVAKSSIKTSTRLTLGDGSTSCCDVSAITTNGSQTCDVNTTRLRRSLGSVVRAENRKLEPGASYQYYVVTATPNNSPGGGPGVSGRSASPFFVASSPSSPFVAKKPLPPSPPSSNIGLIVGLVVVAIVLLILIVLAIVYRRPLSQRVRKRDSSGNVTVPVDNRVPLRPVQHNANQEDSFDDASETSEVDLVALKIAEYNIAPENLLQVYSRKRANEDRMFTDEFKKVLPDMVAKAKVSTKYAVLAQQHGKNRFKNILPSDQSRVVLKKLPNQAMSDYVNASYIDGYATQRKFIAAQGPKNTSDDFWRMIIENECRVIVMLTQLVENNKEKCDKYWPNLGMEEQYGNTLVKQTSQTSFGDYVCRTLSVTTPRIQTPIEVKQFQFVAWPDHGILDITSTIFRLHEAATSAQPTSKPGPIVVHCSAGVGRTGTFIALDCLIDQLQKDDASRPINVFGVVYNMRLNRTEMVQTVGQYMFIHKLVTELLTLRGTEVKASDFMRYFDKLKGVDRNMHVTGLKLQFDVLDVVPPSKVEKRSANKSINKHLNNDASVLPYDHSIAFVGMLSKDKEIPYLNGSSVHAYNVGFYYLSVQNPPPHNANNFWRCVTDNDVACIVMIEENVPCFEYWSGENSSHFPEFSIELEETLEFQGYTERNLQVTRHSSSSCHRVKQIAVSGWKGDRNSKPDISTLLEVLPKVERYHTDRVDVRGKKFVALVHCSDGSSKSGTFIAIANLLERLKNENRVDVLRAVKDLRDCRPAMVGDIAQYEFCYQAVADYIQSFDLYGNFK